VAAATARVLVVDDNEVNRFVVVEHLQQRGYSADTALDGKDAFDKFKANEYACILMDCQMPVMDGYAATRAIRNLERELGRERTPIIALTAHALAGERERVLAAGMDDFLSKPFHPSTLDGILRRYSGPSSAPESAIAGTGSASPSARAVARRSDDLDPEASRSEKLIRLFLERMPEQIAALGRAVDTEDAQEMRALCHKIKGSAQALAAGRMSETAAGMQHQAEQGDLSPMPLELRRLQQQYVVVAHLLNAELARQSEPSGASALEIR
jgi:CheY-like chemotaxis protein